MLRYRDHHELVAIAYVRYLPAICGVGLYGDEAWVRYGGYSHLDRPVPLFWPKDEATPGGNKQLLAFDTLVTDHPPPASLGFATKRCFGEICVARRAGGCLAVSRCWKYGSRNSCAAPGGNSDASTRCPTISVRAARPRRAEDDRSRMTPSRREASLDHNNPLAGLHPATTVRLLIAALWLATRPYYGTVYDGRYYVLLAVRRLYPAAFADDFLFQFGTLERFTIFPNLAAQVIAIFGVALGAMLLTIVGQLLWLGGLVYCAFGFLRDRWVALLSVAAVIAPPAGYFRYGYGEPILTSRLFAEAVALLALGCLGRGRTVASLGLLVVALAIYPIMAVAGVGVVLIYLALQRPVRWWVIAAGAGVAILLAILGVPPFANVFARLDPAWFAIARARNSDTVITEWSIEDYCWIAPTIALAVMACFIGAATERRLFAAALIVGIGALICAILGSMLANVFILQMMPSRSMWLPTVLAHLYVVPMLVWLRAQAGVDPLTKAAFLSALGCLLASRLIPPLVLVAAPVTVIAVAIVIWQLWSARPLSAPARVVCLLAIGTTGGATILFAYHFVIALLPVPDDLRQALWSFAVVLAAVALAAAQWRIANERDAAAGRWLPLASAALIPIALLGWDARSPWTKMIENQGPALAALLPERGSIYWEGGVDLLWFGMLRSSYFSCAQGGGAIFFRAAAFEFRRRSEIFCAAPHR